jgi:hypothetical protein
MAIQRRADYLNRAVPKAGARIKRETEAFTSWRQSLSRADDDAFLSFVACEIYPPDRIAPARVSDIDPVSGERFEMTPEIELAFHQANMEFWRRWEAQRER